MTKIYQVGGSIRDEILGLNPKDIDFVVVAPSYNAMRELIIARGGKIFLETEKFLTIRANVPELGSADYVLARKDGVYSDGRRPDSVEVGTILDDLSRRDFSMNAMARDVETRELIDPFGGQADTVNGVIRCVGNAHQRFQEDMLRVFRAARFMVTKNFILDDETHEALRNAVRIQNARFAATSTSRIWEELNKMFLVNSFKAFYVLDQLELMWLVEERGIWFKPSTEKRT